MECEWEGSLRRDPDHSNTKASLRMGATTLLILILMISISILTLILILLTFTIISAAKDASPELLPGINILYKIQSLIGGGGEVGREWICFCSFLYQVLLHLNHR